MHRHEQDCRIGDDQLVDEDMMKLSGQQPLSGEELPDCGFAANGTLWAWSVSS
jgi:hypothetical protein